MEDNSSKTRTRTTQNNIILSALIKIIGIGTSLILIPLTLDYINPVEYGIWLTLNSILLWVNNFDIGLGNGLRNKLSEALAKGNYLKAKKYISTSYIVMTVIMTFVFIIFYIINNYIDWYSILNINKEEVNNIEYVVIICFSLFCLNFILKLIGSILLAQQKAALESLLVMLGQVLALLGIFLLTKFVEGSLFIVALVYSLAPIIIYFCSYFFVFSGKNFELFPRFTYFDKSTITELFNLGLKFFILQISGLVIFSTSNILISYLFGPEEVTKYNIAFKYFNVVPLLFTVVLAPIWSATTDAYAKNDMEWIKKAVKKVQILLLLALIGLILMIICANTIYYYWIGNINIPIKLSVSLAIYNFLLISSLSYSSFLNGIGKLKVQMINIFVCSLLFIPIVFLLCQFLDLLGIIFSLIIVNLSGLILNMIQFNLIINKKAKGVWNS